MKFRNLFFILFSLVFIAFSSSCKKDAISPDEIVQPNIGQKSQVAEKPSGLANSSDENAQTCAGYFDQINGIMDMLSMFEVPKNADLVDTKSTGVWTWTWEEGGIEVWMTWTETDAKYTWEYEVDYLNQGRVRYLYAEENKDGSNGLLNVYSGYDDSAAIVYNWTYDNNENLNFEMNFGSSLASLRIEANINADGSGNYSYYFNSDLWYYVAWNLDGSGYYTYYDLFGGEFTWNWTV